MKNILFLILFVSLKLSAQDNLSLIPNCDDFSFTIESNTRNTLSFISQNDYNRKLKDSIKKPKKIALKEDKILYKEFQKKFPDKISTHCIRGEQYGSGRTEKISYCSDRQKILLTGKEQNFYIFKLDAFEIDSYILFNTENEIIYYTENYPLIYDNGKIIFDIGYFYDGLKIISYYKFYDKKTEYFELKLPAQYIIKNYNIIRNPRIHLIAELGKLSNSKKSSEENNFCGKFLMIDQFNLYSGFGVAKYQQYDRIECY